MSIHETAASSDSIFSIPVAQQEDIAAIVEIYNQAVKLKSATADMSPTSIEERIKWLAEHSPSTHPVFIAENDSRVVGWCSISPYRPGREALRYTAEISYYVHQDYRQMGVASQVIAHTIGHSTELKIKTLFAILLDINTISIAILKKFGFSKWGHMPRVADFDGVECGHL